MGAHLRTATNALRGSLDMPTREPADPAVPRALSADRIRLCAYGTDTYPMERSALCQQTASACTNFARAFRRIQAALEKEEDEDKTARLRGHAVRRRYDARAHGAVHRRRTRYHR